MSDTIDNDGILKVAALMDKDDPASLDEFDAQLRKLDSSDLALVLFVARLLDSRPYAVRSDNLATVDRYKALAKHVGATIDLIDESDSFTKIIFRPQPTM